MTRIKIYEYSGKPPTENLDLIEEQIDRADSYYNDLVSLERSLRDARASILCRDPLWARLQDELKVKQAEIETVYKAIQAHRAKTRTAEVSPENKAQAKSLKEEQRQIFAQLKSISTAVRKDPEIEAALKSADDCFYELKKVLRANCQVYSGTYQVVEAAFDSARKPNKLRRPGPQKPEPRYRYRSGIYRVEDDRLVHRGQGHLAIQVHIAQGIHTTDIHNSEDRRVWIEPVPATCTTKARNTVVHYRIKSTEKGAPIWTKMPINYYREMPPGQIKMVHLIRRFYGTVARWFIQFAVQLDDSVPRPYQAGHGIAGVELGWKQLDDGSLRVAVVQDEFGHRKELRLPASILGIDKETESLRSIRSRSFDLLKEKIAVWVESLRPDQRVAVVNRRGHTRAMPEPKDIRLWRDPQRVFRLLYDAGHLMPEDFRAELVAWDKHDKHLWDWEAHSRRKILNQRKYVYRAFALELATTYSMLVIADLDLRTLARRGPIEEDTEDSRKHHHNRVVAAISDLRLCLQHAVDNAEGARLYRADVDTNKCHGCGHSDDWDSARQQEHECSHCGWIWDKDDNQAKNLVAAGATAPPPDPPKTKVAGGRFRKKATTPV